MAADLHFVEVADRARLNVGRGMTLPLKIYRLERASLFPVEKIV